MASRVQDRVTGGFDLTDKPATHAHPSSRDVFHTMEQIGKRSDIGDAKQRIAAIAIAVLICVAMYALLYLAMH